MDMSVNNWRIEIQLTADSRKKYFLSEPNKFRGNYVTETVPIPD